ncbi:MAG: type transport system ATP-binding protein [Actinomycetota bacterium]|jgi:ABC-2 type transport system ATP-binding protein|nr:type transport system ATP-binding protein [Actinomycetota bacterium]
MRSPRLLAALLIVAATGLTAAAPVAQAATAPGDDRVGANAPYTWTTRDFRLPVTDNDMFGNPVSLDAEVLIPNGTGPFAGLLINHGYLGDKHGDGDTARAAAALGYIVLRYTSRGFGAASQPDPSTGELPSPAPIDSDGQGTKGQVDLVGGPETRDMVQAVAWLNNPANVPIWVDHIGHYGGSYGGAHDYALAQQDLPAVRALVPAATWTDLYDGLAPNGVLKAAYMSGFYAAGRERFDGYNNYDPEIDAGYAKMLSSTDLDGLHAMLKDHSISGKWDKVHTPIFLVQGLNDGLFDGNEAIQSYIELSKNLGRDGKPLPVHLYLGGIGHPPARSSDGPEIAHVGAEVLAFLDHYVREIDNGIEKAPPIEFATTQYFDNPDFAPGEAGIAARAHAADVKPFEGKLPFGTPTVWHLCGTAPGAGTLQLADCPNALPSLLAAGTGGDPTSEPVALHPNIPNNFQKYFGRPWPSTATPVDVVSFDGPALSAATTYAGIPTLRLSVVSDPPTTGLGGPTPPVAAFQIDPKVYDVAPDGTATLITRGAYAEQPGGGAPGVHTSSFDAFAMAWTFLPGHHLRLSLSSADIPYLRPNAAAFQVAVLPGSAVDMPGAEKATLTPFGVTAPQDPMVPEVPYAALLPLAGIAVAGAVVFARRRRT